jgi:hypothetical protein
MKKEKNGEQKKVLLKNFNKGFKYNSNINKIVWLCFLVGFALLILTSLITSTTHYFQYDTGSKIETISERPTDFPAVTICGNNPFSTKLSENLMMDLRNNSGFKIKDSDLPLMTKILVASDDYSKDAKKLLGIPIFYFDLDSKFDNRPIKTIKEFSYFHSFNYGNCWQFNSGTNSQIKKTHTEGKTFGFSIMGVFENNNNLITSNSNGLAVFIHNQTIPPAYLDEPYLVSTGKETNIVVNRIFIQNAPIPYSDCSDSLNSELALFLINKLNQTYRQKDCLNMCRQRIIQSVCGCYFTALPKFLPTVACLNGSQIECVNKQLGIVFNQKHLDNCNAECPIECEYVNYEITMSSLDFPSKSAYKELVKRNAQHKKYSYELFKEYSFHLHVFYPHLHYVKITQSPKISHIDFFINTASLIVVFLMLCYFSLTKISNIFVVFLRKKTKKTNI